MLYLTDRPASDHEIGFTAYDGSNQFPDILSAVLIVRIGIDDNIGPASRHASIPERNAFASPLLRGRLTT